MENSRKKISILVIGLSIGLSFMGILRHSATNENFLTPFSGLATPGYVLISVLFTIWLVRAGLPLNKYGFGAKLKLNHIILAIFAIIVLRVFSYTLNPIIEELFSGQRNLERFSDVEGSTISFVMLLITNWTLAAFGEEFAYRILLMRGLSYVFGDSRSAQISALILQSIMFGLIHAYQGPTGIVGSAFSGLVFGTVILIGRWSIWPATLAHGANNTIGIIALYLGE
ncbi:CPBP family intramembrane glutamic endopeptidase [Candidatus Neomarinimicrobiota bacterium]